jgi:hypothetical protein
VQSSTIGHYAWPEDDPEAVAQPHGFVGPEDLAAPLPHRAVFTSARMAARMCSGRVGHAEQRRTKSGSEGACCASGAESWGAASPEVLAGKGLCPASFRLLTGLFQVRVLVGELVDPATSHNDRRVNAKPRGAVPRGVVLFPDHVYGFAPSTSPGCALGFDGRSSGVRS